ncbi:MAG TPA: hypothetical protein VK208_20840 [Pyrinomonadaceae bacterium]|nr:hypothetical protein [Pyrinomonadaceae bacterium]
MTETNSRLVKRVLIFLVLLTLLAGTVLDVSAQRRKTRRGRRTTTRVVKPPVQYYTIPADTVMRVRINEQLNSGTARVGDRFSSNVVEPVYAAGGVEVVPVGSKVWGRVTQVSRAQKRSPGNITVAFNSITLPNSRTAVINGSLTTLEADAVSADNEGTVKGTSNRKRDVVFIGGGAAGGAIIGAIAGGGKGAAIGGILGGALGAGARVFEKEKEAEVKSGTEFGVILNRSVSLPASTVR